jgi:large subunit ribosomal protein L1
MNKDNVLNLIKAVRESSKERKFNQSFDLIINLKDLNLKKPEENIDLFVTLPHSKGKKVKICALINKSLEGNAKVFDKFILLDDFPQDAKEIKKLAVEYDFFVGQAEIMPKIASTFGKIIGSRGKMPSPKLGCIVTAMSDLNSLKKKLENTIRLKTKNEIIIKAMIGTQSMNNEEVYDNFMAVYNALVHALPKAELNLKSIYLKLTMSKSFKLGENLEKSENVEEEKKVRRKR